MSKIVTYRLPPYVTLVDNPHYTGGDTSYAQTKLQSLGNYPLGTYTVHSNAVFGGAREAIASTNNSITLLYPDGTSFYPAKTSVDFMDINTYSFAYTAYNEDPATEIGCSRELLYNPYIFDFDAYEGQDSTQFNQIEAVATVNYTIGIIPETGNPYTPATPFTNCVMPVYGHLVVQLQDLPGFTEDTFVSDLDSAILPNDSLTSLRGRYLIVINDIEGFGGKFNYDIYPAFPNDRKMEIRVATVGNVAPSIINKANQSGKTFTFTYDSLYRNDTGPGVSVVFPFHSNVTSLHQPVLITLPSGSQSSAFRFYRGTRDVDFDLYNNTEMPLQGDEIIDAVPANFIRIDIL